MKTKMTQLIGCISNCPGFAIYVFKLQSIQLITLKRYTTSDGWMLIYIIGRSTVFSTQTIVKVVSSHMTSVLLDEKM